MGAVGVFAFLLLAVILTDNPRPWLVCGGTFEANLNREPEASDAITLARKGTGTERRHFIPIFPSYLGK